jgi:hypothetical protein
MSYRAFEARRGTCLFEQLEKISARRPGGQSRRRSLKGDARVHLVIRCLSAATLVASVLISGCGDDQKGPPPLTGGPAIPTDGGADPGSSLACANKPAIEPRSALLFDGVDDYVTMGPAPLLGLDHFTLEAWVRREGTGVPFGTGVGGISLVPIMGKGRGESDGTNVDCNYAFGFAGDVIGADFEDAATGANHPVNGKTKIPMGEWHHVAVSYDGAKWQLFVDGKLDAELATANAALPRKDSIQHFALGTALDSKGVPAGFLKGALDEARVWNHARTEAEITGAMYKRLDPQPGLLGRWALDEKDLSVVVDATGTNNGNLKGGAIYDKNGAALESGAPPKIVAPSPGLAAEVVGATAELKVTIEDPDSKDFTATFHVRSIGDGDDFTIVVLPDTQYYTRAGDNPSYYLDQTKWIMDNANTYNIVGVIHNGDIVDNGDMDAQWAVADRAMATLEKTSPRFPDGMPYGTCAGNHDQSPNGALNSTAKYNLHYGTTRFGKRAYFGGVFAGGKVDENWFTFNAGGLDFVVVNLQYGEVAREASVLSWTRSIFQQHPDAFGIVNSHFILNSVGNFGAAGQSIYDAVKDVENVQLMTCGHVGAEQKRTDVFQGHPVHSMLADYQFRANGGAGVMRIWELSPKNDELTVRSYSPTDKKFETDADSEFTLKVDLSGSGKSPFKEQAKIDPAAVGEVKTVLDGLAPGQTYEWYVSLTDCAHTVRSPLYRFKTK